ncbi:MAG TPA: type I restriction endonuclease subunit R [Cyanobacteria bacterium UBA8803]|nr:type I restriction endonuclease subunit R [Cyanobacteria bacterium UBA9273]HBL59496.1 type I restriction endonuclease subunit R [Cyanobacteria bacterium UBA8803]
MTTNARTLTLTNLRHNFGVRLNPNDSFFAQWLKQVPPLTEAEQQGLERLTRNYTYLSQEDPPLEEVVKLVVVSPLLDLADFYQPPFLIRTEVGTTLEVADEPDISPIQGKIDILVVQETLWILAIESKPARLDVTAGIPQALTYLLSAPTSQSVLYGMVTNGREVLFVRLYRSQPSPQYSRSLTYRLLENAQEREQVLQGLKYLGTLLPTEALP